MSGPVIAKPIPPLEKTYVPTAGGGTQKVYFFPDAGLQTSINSALAGVTERSALLHLEKNPTGLNAAIAAKLNGHWSVAAAFQRSDWGDSVGTTVKFSW